MRSLVLALALAAPTSAFAAVHLPFKHTPNLHTPKAQSILVEFRNASVQSRSLVVGDTCFRLGHNEHIKLSVNTGDAVRVTSDVNSRVKTTLEIQASDANRTVIVE